MTLLYHLIITDRNGSVIEEVTEINPAALVQKMICLKERAERTLSEMASLRDEEMRWESNQALYEQGD